MMQPQRTAYLVSEYPKLSHAFIEREVRALRAQGVEVHTFSVRPAPAAQLLSQADRDEADRTTALLSSRAVLLRSMLDLLAREPAVLLDGARRALHTGPRTARQRVWQLFYLVEAVLLVQHMRALGLRHVHVHFANNGADVARHAVALGNALDGGGWTWSLAMHGPTELADVTGFDLAAKVRSASFVACISDFCRSQLMALVEPAHWDTLHLVRMSVDAERFEAAERPPRAVRPLRVLFVGRLVPEKGPSVLLRAAARVASGAVEVRFVGDGPLRAGLEAEVSERGLSDRVRLLGPIGQDDLPAQYAWADVFCLPSFAEGLPVVLMEALAAGCAVVTTPIAGIPELVEPGRTGVLVAPGRDDLLAAALERLAAPEERAEYQARGRARVRELHSPAVNATLLRDLLPH
jgi:colanic acid/amylovoran biosynthesis glycosyltransferase